MLEYSYVGMNVFYLSILTTSQLVSQVNAAAESFIVPPQGAKSLSYREGSKLSLSWDTSLDWIALTLWQDGIDSSFEYIGGFLCGRLSKSYQFLTFYPDLIKRNKFSHSDGAGNVSNSNSWPWRVFTENQNITDTSTFFIAIFKPGETRPRFSSSHFSILRASAASTTPGAPPSSSSVPTSSSSSSVPPSFPSSSVSTPSLSSLPSDSGLNSRTKTGLGLGLGIGIPFVLGLGIFLGCFLRPNRRNAAGDVGDDNHKPMKGDYGNLPSPQQTYGLIPMQELGPTETGRELDSYALHELGSGTQPR